MSALRILPAAIPLLLVAAATGGCGDDAGPGTGGSGGAPASTSTGAAVSAGGTGGQGGEQPGAECAVDADCKLVIGCCTCGAAPLAEPPDPCEATADCDQSQCSALGIPEDTVAACAEGRCVMGFACDLALVTCDGPEPECEDGETPRVVDGCHAGCVPEDECRPAAP